MQTLTRNSKLVPPGEGQVYQVLSDRVTCKASREDTDGVYSFFEIACPPQGGTPLHYHRLEDEAFYVIEGDFALQVGEDQVMAPAGSFVYFPRYVPHAYKNVGETDGTLLVLTAPGGYEDFFADMNEVTSDGMPDLDAVYAVTQRHQVQILLPDSPAPEPTDRQVVHLGPGEGETHEVLPGDVVRIKATGEATEDAVYIHENFTEPGAGTPFHLHRNEDEAFYILEGSYSFQVEDQAILATAGTFLMAPRGSIHRFQNTGDTLGRMLVVCNPAGIEGFFRKMSLIDHSDGLNLDAVIAVANEYRIELMG